MRNLRWLSLLGTLGLLGTFTGNEMFFGLFGFFAFLPLFWCDERTEAVIKQSAIISYVVTTFSLAGTFLYLGIVLGPGLRNADSVNLVGICVTALAAIYMLHLLVFALSYIYFELRGFRR